MPTTEMVTKEEIEAKKLELYPIYQAFQRDGSFSMSTTQANDLLDIHLDMYKTGFCTTCREAITGALNACFRSYEPPTICTTQPKAVLQFKGNNKERGRINHPNTLPWQILEGSKEYQEIEQKGLLKWYK